MSEPPPFVPFATDHLAALAVTALLAAGMIAVARRGRRPRLMRAQEKVLAALLLLSWPADALAAAYAGALDWEAALPGHLCDVAALCGAWALLTGHRLAAELVYFFGIAGTLNGLITPNLVFACPHPAYFSFFLLHGGVVLTALYVVLGRRWWPRPGAVGRVLAAGLGYLILVSGINAALGTNFAFLRHKPETASLMDALGPWPWYVGALVPLAAVAFSLCYAPFFFLRKFWPEKCLTTPVDIPRLPPQPPPSSPE